MEAGALLISPSVEGEDSYYLDTVSRHILSVIEVLIVYRASGEPAVTTAITLNDNLRSEVNRLSLLW